MAAAPDWSPCRVDLRELRRKQGWRVHIGLLGVVLVYAGTFGLFMETEIGALIARAGALLVLGSVVTEIGRRGAGNTRERKLEAQARERGMSGGLWVKVRYRRDGWEYGRDEGIVTDVGPYLVFEGWHTSFAVPLSDLKSRDDRKRRRTVEYRLAVEGTGVELSFFSPNRMPELVSVLESQGVAPPRMALEPLPRTPRPRTLRYALERGWEATPKWFVAFVPIVGCFVMISWEMGSPLALFCITGLALVVSYLLGILYVLGEDRWRLREWRASLDASLPQLGVPRP